MDMAADHAVNAAPTRLGDHGVFERIREVYSSFDLELDVTRERPGSETKLPPGPAQRWIETARQPRTPAAEDRQPSAVPHDAIELVSMRDQHPQSRRGFVNAVAHDLEAAQLKSAVVTQSLVVVARNEYDSCTVAHLIEKRLHDIIMGA